MSTKAKTHAARGSGTRMAEIRGASVADIRRAGRWSNGAMENCYLSQLPRETMRVLAGFSKDGGSFFLKRACIIPSEALSKQIFPEIDDLLAQNEGRDGNIAAVGFLRLLKELRIIFLQDSIPLKKLYPNHPIWRLQLFQRDEYKSFAESLTSTMETVQNPIFDKLKVITPVISSKLDQILNGQNIGSDLIQQVNDTKIEVQKALSILEDMTSGRVTFAMQRQHTSTSASTSTSTSIATTASTSIATTAFTSASTATSATTTSATTSENRSEIQPSTGKDSTVDYVFFFHFDERIVSRIINVNKSILY